MYHIKKPLIHIPKCFANNYLFIVYNVTNKKTVSQSNRWTYKIFNELLLFGNFTRGTHTYFCIKKIVMRKIIAHITYSG